MQELTKTQTLRKEILQIIYQQDIPWFLKEEIVEITKLLNYYKLNNLFQNIDKFLDYLNKLAQNYNKQTLYIINKNLSNESIK